MLNNAAQTQLQSFDYHMLFQVMPVGIVIVDDKGLVSSHNPRAQTLLKTSLNRRPWIDVINEVFAPRQDDGHDVSMHNGCKLFIDTAPLGKAGQVLILHDVTDSRAFQDSIKQQERLYLMGKMAAQLAHQLRTPLASALLKVDQIPHLNHNLDDLQSCVTDVKERLKAIEHHIQQLLVFAKGGSHLTEKIEVRSLIAKLIENIQPVALQNEIIIKYQHHGDDATIIADVSGLIGAFENMIINAIEANATLIEIQSQPLGHNRCQIKISDNGNGISMVPIERIFDPFLTSKAHGTGIGLAIVKNIINSHQGTIEVASEKLQGVCFTIQLPLIGVLS